MPIEGLIERAVKDVIEAGGWPVYQTYDDRGLDDEEYVQFAKQVLAALPHPTPTAADTPAARALCERCQGNGEIVTDWERYMKPHKGDAGDEAVAECPDCNGEGRIGQVEPLPAAADTGLVERLTAELAESERISDTYKQCAEDWRSSHEAAAQREAAAREQIAALERERAQIDIERANWKRWTGDTEAALSSAQEAILRLTGLLAEARDRIAELRPDGCGEWNDALKRRIDTALAGETQG